MVTQDAAVMPKVNKMKMKKMKKKLKKKKMKGANAVDSDSEADKLDLEQKIYPLSHYILDQEELVNQMFLTISGSKLEAMLPPVLKSTPLTELKRLCIHELRGMSKKRILCCINGEAMEGSSGSEDDDDDKEETAAEHSTHNDANAKGDKRKPDDQFADSYLLKKIKVEPGLEDSTGSGESKSVLELLELEMRARIIKTMLEKGDDGKKITEDAIAAVIQTTKQLTEEGADTAMRSGTKEATNAMTASKGNTQKKDSVKGVADDNEAVEERSRGRRKSHGKEGERRRRRRPAGDSRRHSSRHERRGDCSHSDEGSSRRQKDPNATNKHVAKKKKITRKEFEERMKRAKKNRTYRQRKTSDDDEKAKESDDNKLDEEDAKEDSKEKTKETADVKTQDAAAEGNTKEGVEGDASEKEEGEIDSNEEEEGACSPTDISSASHYSSSSSCSRSYSRSCSRSHSRSPYRGRQRRSRRSRSRSRGRKRRRSYSRSYSRSRSAERRKGRSEQLRRSCERKRSGETLRSNSRKDNKRSSPAEEEDWGHKCDIEFVDSEEDFDDNAEAAKKEAAAAVAQKSVPVNRIERASISFSLQKKPSVGIAQTVDLDDLPLKKKQMEEEIETIPLNKATPSEEIVISSDSEVEAHGPTKKTQNSSKVSNEQTEKLTVARLDETKKVDTSSIKENVEVQENQAKIVKKTVDAEMKMKIATEGMQEENSEASFKLTTHTSCDKQAEKSVKDTEEDGLKKKSQTSDSKIGRTRLHCSENTSVDTDNAPEEADRENRNVSPNNREDNNSKSTRTDLTEAPNDGSEENVKEKDSDSLCGEKEQENETETPISEADVMADENNLTETQLTKSSSKKTQKRKTGRVTNLKPKTLIQSADNGIQREAVATVSSEIQNQTFKGTGVESRDGNTLVYSDREEREEKSDSSVSSELKKEEARKEDVATVFGDQSEEDFYKGTEPLGFSDDEKESEGKVIMKQNKRMSVDPIRMETGLIRRRVQSPRKIEMIVPEKSWMKRGKKKKEKTQDVLPIEGIGLLKSSISEGVQSSSQDSELETQAKHSELEADTSQNIEPVEATETREVIVKAGDSAAVVSDSDNSQPQQRLSSPSPKRDASPQLMQAEDKSVRKTDHDTEIIGVIETSKELSNDFDDMELGRSSWSMRWLQSEKVQKVVSSSKMLSRVRKKIQKKEKATKVVMAEKVEETQKPAESVVPVIGSIEEYERLFGTKIKKDEAAEGLGTPSQESSGQAQALGDSGQAEGDHTQAKKDNPVFGSDDDGEDSEEEELWSKIIKK